MSDPAIHFAIYNEVRELMEEAMADFVHTYLDNTPRLIDRMEQALTRTEADAIYQSAHQLKGGSGSIGALRLAELALGIEKIAKAGSTQGIAPLLNALKLEYQRVEQELKTLL